MLTSAIVTCANVVSIDDAKAMMRAKMIARGKPFDEVKCTVAIVLACLSKCAMYTVLGPIGLYRVHVCALNNTRARDSGYMKPIDCPAWWMIGLSRKYMMWPIGGVSWVPIPSSEVIIYIFKDGKWYDDPRESRS